MRSVNIWTTGFGKLRSSVALTRAFSGAVCKGQVGGVGAGEGTGSPVAGALCSIAATLLRPGFRLEEVGWPQ